MHVPPLRVGGPFAAVGRFCFRHRRLVLALWAVLIAVGFVFGTRVFDTAAPSARAAGSESAAGSALLSAANPADHTLQALVDLGGGHTADEPAVRGAVQSAVTDLGRMPGVAQVSSPYAADGAGLRASDGRAVLVEVRFSHDSALRPAEQRLDAAAAQAPGAKVEFGGQMVLNSQVQQQTRADTEHGEYLTLPLVLVVMVLIFGGFLAAGLPLLGAVGSVAGALLALLGFSKVMAMDTSVLPIATVLGLGLSIDYALLVVNRFREERALGATVAMAVERTSATAGRTIAFSALTVAAALSGLLVFESPIFRAVGAAGVSVVVITVLSGMTLVPALLGVVGHRIKPARRGSGDDGFFARTVRRVQKRALPVALLVSAGLVACAAPFLTAHAQSASTQILPSSFSSRAVADQIEARFPQQRAADVTVVVRGTQAQAAGYAAAVDRLPGVVEADAQAAGDGLSTVAVSVKGSAQGATAQSVVRELRADRGGLTTWVTGDAASVVDFKHEVATRGPWALGLMVAATFVLLFLMTGSVVMPVKALIMNLLSIGSSLGVLTLVFQQGWFASVVGATPTGGLEAWIPVLVTAFAFGLSMDYEVFLLSRIKELHDQGYDCRTAVQLGVQRSGRIITSAALLMVIVFAGFSTGSMLDIKEIGLALAVAVAVDATLVRMLLVPAAMSLFGNANWWAPGWLRRLHERVGLAEHLTLPPLPRPRALARLPLALPRDPKGLGAGAG